MGYLSKAYAYLANTYELVEAEPPKTLRLKLDDFEYDSGTGNENLPTNVLRVHTVKLTSGDGAPLGKMDVDGVNYSNDARPSGLPSKYGIRGTNANRKLIINSIPDKSYADDNTYALIIYYKEKIFRFNNDQSVGSFTDLDFTDETGGWGGEFKLPTEWEDLMIAGAVAYATGIGSLKSEFIAMAEQMNKKRDDKTYVNRKPKYRLGVWNK
jgi:hypothetical protein